MPKINFTNYLNGNPAMLEIWSDALERIFDGQPLAPVQVIVVREWLTRAKARMAELLLKSQRGFLQDEGYAELAAVIEQIRYIEISMIEPRETEGGEYMDEQNTPNAPEDQEAPQAPQEAPQGQENLTVGGDNAPLQGDAQPQGETPEQAKRIAEFPKGAGEEGE